MQFRKKNRISILVKGFRIKMLGLFASQDDVAYSKINGLAFLKTFQIWSFGEMISDIHANRSKNICLYWFGGGSQSNKYLIGSMFFHWTLLQFRLYLLKLSLKQITRKLSLSLFRLNLYHRISSGCEKRFIKHALFCKSVIWQASWI